MSNYVPPWPYNIPQALWGEAEAKFVAAEQRRHIEQSQKSSPKLNPGHEIELRHTAYVALEVFNAHVRDHPLAQHLEATSPDFAAKLEAASDALYQVYNSVPRNESE